MRYELGQRRHPWLLRLHDILSMTMQPLKTAIFRQYNKRREITVPTVLFLKGWRFFFYSNEGNEPPHIHVVKAEAEGKFWLDHERYSDD